MSLIIFFFSFYWPPVDKSDSSGSFTKADRYRNEQAGDKEILLRSEFISDTLVLAKSIKDLIAFGDFSLQLKKLIDQYWIPQLDKYNKAAAIQGGIDKLMDYSNFIQNNISTIQNTIGVLSEFYYKKNENLSTDVEAKVKTFYNYVNQFLIRDSIFEYTIAQIDVSIKNDQFRKTELSNLKSLRDKMVIETLIYGTSIGDSSKIKFSANQVISNPKTISETYKNIQLEITEGQNQHIEMTFLSCGSNQGLSIYPPPPGYWVTQARTECSASMFFNAEKLNQYMSAENLKNVNNASLKEIYDMQSKNLYAAAGDPILFGNVLDLNNVGLSFNNRQFNLNAVNQNVSGQPLNQYMGNHQLGMFASTSSNIFNFGFINAGYTLYF
jgi:hypothetical protein